MRVMGSLMKTTLFWKVILRLCLNVRKLWRIFAAISELPESYRSVLILRYQMDMKNAEIAEILGVSRKR